MGRHIEQHFIHINNNMNLILILGLLLLDMLVSGTRISQTKCAEYRKMFPLQYHDGEDAAPKEFPFMAKIDNITHYFNGILISENFVLSAAHINFSDAMVILGELELGTEMDDAQPKTYKVIDTFTHPDFNQHYSFANIKLYQLNESIKFDEYVRPACLSLNSLSVSEDLTQIGWDRTNIRDNNILHKLSMNYISNKRCKDVYKIANRQSQVKDIDKKTIFCAESRKGSRRMINGVGSAFIHDDQNASDEVIGFLSNSLTSEEANVTVVVRVSSYIDWIESKVWHNHSTSTPTQPADEIETTTLPSPTNEFGARTFPTKFIYLIIGTILMTLALGTLIVYFSLFKSKARLNTVRFQINQDTNTLQVESLMKQ